jgi:hypothetical protein
MSNVRGVFVILGLGLVVSVVSGVAERAWKVYQTDWKRRSEQRTMTR